MNKDEYMLVPKSVKSPGITAEMPCKEMACRSLDFYFQNFLWNEKGARIAKDPEFLHYFRVASKRLRTALTVFKDYLPDTDISRHICSLKSLGSVLGKARDTDVYIEFLNNKASKLMLPKELKSFNRYRSFFLKRRNLRQKSVLKKLDSEEYKLFVSEFKDFISRNDTVEKGDINSTVSEIIDRRIKTKLKKLLVHSEKLNHKSSEPKLHGFRKKCRKRRYEVELFLNITGDQGKELDRMLIELQRSLGSHHDAVTAGKKLNYYIKTHKKYSKSRILRKLRKLQNQRAMKFRKKFFEILFHMKKHSHTLSLSL